MNLSNMSGLNSFDTSLRSFEIQEAQKRMGMTNAATNTPQNMGMTNASVPSLNNSITTGTSEVQQVRQNMNPGLGSMTSSQSSANMTSLNSIPGFTSSLTTDSGEIQQAKREMNQSSSMNNLLY